MTIPAVIDNSDHRLADALNELLGQCGGSPVDIATAYFSISGYRLVRERLHQSGALRLLTGSSPETGADVGLRPDDTRGLKARLRGDLEGEPFTPETLKVVEDLIGFLRSEKVEVRLYNNGFLHAKAYLFHKDQVGAHNRADRMQPYAAIVGSSNFTGPGLVSNRELNIVHRVVLPDEEAYDLEAARGVAYIQPAKRRETLLDPSGVDVPDTARRFINSEVGARAVIDLRQWYERHWNESVDFKEELIELLDASKFGGTYRKKEAIEDKQEYDLEKGREMALVGIFKTRFLKRLESSIAAFRESIRRALTFEETYYEYLLGGTVVSSRDFQKAIRYLARDEEDELAAGSMADEIDAVAEAKQYIDALPKVDLNQYDLRKLTHEVDADVKLLRELFDRTQELAEDDEKLESLKRLLAGELKGRKVLVFSSYKDTARYVERTLNGADCAAGRKEAGDPLIRRLDSGNHPDERTRVLGLFAPVANRQDTPEAEQIDILISTDVLSEGQNLQDCGVIVNYDLTWNPIRLVQRNGRIDRLGSVHSEIRIYNMFPEEELEQLLHLVERLTTRISVIDDLGLLDASVLGEVVHPRTFNVLRRLRDGDTAILDEEEQRAELAGPELLLKQLKDLLNRDGAERLTELPDGIHSGLRREKCYGMFFYFQAPRWDGQGKRHFWRYIDARTHEVNENRFEIAQRIGCLPDEPRYIGDQDVFTLQEKVINQILVSDREVEAKAAAAAVVDPVQQAVAEEIKNAIRRGKVDREAAKRCLVFLGQAMGISLHKKLRQVNDEWRQSRDDGALIADVAALAEEFSKGRLQSTPSRDVRREDLQLICFEYVTG